MKNKKLFASISTVLVFGSVFAASFGIARALQVKPAVNASFNIGAAPAEVKTKVYYQSSFFFGGEGTVYAYAWDSKDDSHKNAAWPGETMTAEDYKHGLYSYEVSDKYDTIIFHANAGESDPTKTNDLTIDRTNVYYSQHNDAWKSKLEDCTFSYYLTGVLNGTSGWGKKEYNCGLLKNYSGGNVNEYMTVDYVPQRGDEFKVIDESGTYYGTGGSTGGSNYKVLQANSANKTVQVYFTPNSNLYSGVNYYYLVSNPGTQGLVWYCHQWPDGSSGTTWPGVKMTRDGEGGAYWYYANVPLYYDCVIFNNKGEGGSGNVQTADLKSIDISKPYYHGSAWSSSK